MKEKQRAALFRKLAVDASQQASTSVPL